MRLLRWWIFSLWPTARAPAVAHTAKDMIAHLSSALAVTCTAQALVETNAAPSPVDCFRHTMERIIDAPVPQLVEQDVPDAASASQPVLPLRLSPTKGEEEQA